jgi:hypothetical protein
MQSSVGNPSRTRSLRVPPAGVFKPVTASTSSTAGISYVALFLTNLRLLDLDLREDWPEISTKTFSTKDAQQNQKRRIQSVEWALYQLFALWDPEEAQNVRNLSLCRKQYITNEYRNFNRFSLLSSLFNPSICERPSSVVSTKRRKPAY